MTTEEKAKAYDEAVNKIRPLYEQAIKDGNPIWSTYEYLIPQLRESEDERIIKTLQDYVKNRNWSLNGPTQAEVLAWLEKLKENPKSSDCVSDAKYKDCWHKVKDSLPNSTREVLCKDAIGNFFIGRYYKKSQGWMVMMYDDCDKSNEDNPPVVKWCEIPTEKQEEQNPVDNEKVEMTDFEQSVYDLCPVLGIDEAKATASDLLELAKKTLLKTGKVVLVSNYPEGCSFEDGFHLGYNEGFNAKQKEQKPITCINFDNEFENQVSHLLASVLNGEHEYNEGFVKHAAQSLLGYAKKEQKPILEVFGFKVGDAVRLKDGDGRKHIIKSFEEVEGIHGPNFYHVEFEDNSAIDGIYPSEKYPNCYYTQMEKFEKEQKPAEWSDEDEKMLNSALWHIKNSCGNGGKTSGEYEVYHWLKSLPERFVLQPKVEWSEDWREEDIQTRFAFYTYKEDPCVLYLSNVFVEESSRNHGFGTRILKAAEKVAEVVGATTISLKVKQDSLANAWYRKNGYSFVTSEDGYDWLKKNLEYLNSKEFKQEWNEDDEQYLLVCRNALYKYQLSDRWDANIIFDWLEKRLKSTYQLKQEWTEEDEKIRKTLLDYYEEALDNYTCVEWLNGITYGELCDWLKSLRPQPKQEWSEEDKKNFYWISTRIQQANMTPEYSKKVYAVLDWLKSLIPQPKQE